MWRIFWIVIFWIIVLGLQVQVYLGDVNNSGKVDQVDVLYIGYVYGSVGLVCIQIGIIFEEMLVFINWM